MNVGQSTDMKTDEIYAKVKKILDVHMETGWEKLDGDADLTEHGMDSMVFIQMVVDIEAEFDIEIPDEYLLAEEMNNISKIINMIYGLKSKKI